ncbi:MAG: hypothetical protein ACRDI0_03745 [Actinomycetota bacterium]
MRPSVLAVLLVLGSLSACGGGGGAVETPSPIASPLTSGRAEVRVTGDVRDRFQVPLDAEATTIYQPPAGGFAVTWGQEGHGLGVGGLLFTGTRSTDQALSVTVTALRDGAPVVLASFDGECEVTIDRADGTGIEGSFRCVALSVRDLFADARGTFSASA